MKKIFFTTLFCLLAFPLFSDAQINLTRNSIGSTVELIWESHSYVPPLYQGKALYPIGGEVTVYALPPAALGNPNTLTYTWKREGIVDGAQSGVGKRSFTFSGSQFGESPLVSVQVSDGSASEFGSVRVLQTGPFVRFYQNKPLEGIVFERALPRNIVTTEKNFDIEAYPFFFTATSRTDSSLSYTWSANGTKLLEAVNGTLSAQADEPSSVYIQLSLNGVKNLLQRATESINITFE